MDALELPQPAPKRLNAFWDSLNESDKPWLLDLLGNNLDHPQ